MLRETDLARKSSPPTPAIRQIRCHRPECDHLRAARQPRKALALPGGKTLHQSFEPLKNWAKRDQTRRSETRPSAAMPTSERVRSFLPGRSRNRAAALGPAFALGVFPAESPIPSVCNPCQKIQKPPGWKAAWGKAPPGREACWNLGWMRDPQQAADSRIEETREQLSFSLILVIRHQKVNRAGGSQAAWRFDFFFWAGRLFHRRCTQKYCSGARRMARSNASV